MKRLFLKLSLVFVSFMLTVQLFLTLLHFTASEETDRKVNKFVYNLINA